VKDLDDKLSDEEKQEITTRIEAVREALKGDDTGAIDSTKQQLAEVLQRVGTRAYEAAGAASGDGTDGAAGGGTGDGEEAGDEGETIEGEYKEV
jgi:molecular chaperone DnaK